MSSSLAPDWQASPARRLSRPVASTWSCWKRATAWVAESTASMWTASTWSSVRSGCTTTRRRIRREFAERANLKLRGTSWEQAALVLRGERRPGAEIKRARGAAERAFGAARATRRSAKPDASLDDALRPLLAGADAVTQRFVRLENARDYGAPAQTALPASLG